MNDNFFKSPRLYINQRLINKGVIALSSAQAHYLHNVLRRKGGDFIRLFNGIDGEWLGILQNLTKKNGEVLLDKQITPQPKTVKHVHLLFAPIKKNRMDWLIEKAVELGVTDLHPILTQNTEVRKIKEERINHQIIEAAEQCERLNIPTLHKVKKLEQILSQWSKDIELLACIERCDAKPIKASKRDIAILIGPEGGFTTEEKDKITKSATIVTLGKQILRSETAALKAISIINATQ